MRFFTLILLFITTTYAIDTISYFKKSSDNMLLCHISQHSFKIISQKNSVIQDIRGHTFFKLIGENLYILSNACQPLHDKESIVFN